MTGSPHRPMDVGCTNVSAGGVELVELGTSGHALFPEQPNDIVEAIRSFAAVLD